MKRFLPLMTAIWLCACGVGSERAEELYEDRCLQMGGSVVGDPGDGSVIMGGCPNGETNLGEIVYREFPRPVEGAICCLP